MVRPMLGELELEQVQVVDADEDQVVVRHQVPGLEGDALHTRGRRGAQVRLTGVLTAAATLEHLADLRARFQAGEPVPFVSDITQATVIDQVLIERMEVRELAGRPDRYWYHFALREFTEPEPVDTEQVDIPPPPPPEVDTGKLSVTVVVEGDPAFDMDRVTVSVHGTETASGAALQRVLTTRVRPDSWFEDPFPAGDYTVEALVDDTATITGQREVLTGSATVTVRNGEVGTATVILRRGSKVGTVFVITYRFDNSFVEPCQRHVLQAVAQYSDAHPDEKLLVVGHTDLVGSDAYNQALSERRARGAYAVLTFGRDAESADRAVAEWDELRRARPAGKTRTVRDTWGTREVQHMLQHLGRYRGNVGVSTGEDAVLTDTAIRQFQRDNGLADDGDVGDATWPVLIRAYLGHDAVGIPADRFLRNTDGAGCDSGPLRWLGCNEQDPVHPTQLPSRRNRRTELMFVHETAMPVAVPAPVTLDLVDTGAGGGTWCLDDGTATSVDGFVVPYGVTCPTGPPDPTRPWCRTPAEPGSFAVTGTITIEDGTPTGSPYAAGEYVITAPDGEYLDGEHASTSGSIRAGTPIPGRTTAAGTFAYSQHKGPGTFSLEVPGPWVARMAHQTVDEARGNAVCFRLDGSSPNRISGNVVLINRAVVAVTPSITAPDVVVVRRPTTNPARVPVALRADAAFTGSGTLTWTSPAVTVFDAAVGGTELTTGAVFTDAQLTAGHTVFVEGVAPSAAVNDVVLTLRLTVNGTPGLSATATLTAVLLTLDVADLPSAAGADRGDMAQAAKVNPGRLLQAQTPLRQAARARLTVRPPQPAGFTGAMVLRRLSAGVDMFATEAVTAADVPLGAEFAVPSPVPAGGARVFAQGTTVSAAPRDTGFQLGLAGGEPDGDRVSMTVATIEVIRADNTVFPIAGDDACHMVSKAVTNVGLPAVATFDGPPPANPDPDTFRVQVRGLPPGTATVGRVQVTRAGTAAPVYSNDFPMLEQPAGPVRTSRSNQHVRLVSNDVDDAHAGAQTAKVRLADDVSAIVLVGGNRLGVLTLPVGRPPAEAGPKAIRTVDLRIVRATGEAIDRAAMMRRVSENWAQLAIRYTQVGGAIDVAPVRNILSVDFPAPGGTAPAAGTLTVDITPAGAAAPTRVITAVAAGDGDAAIAGKLAARISANAGLAASVHRHQNQFLVMVNRGTNVVFANVATTVAGLLFVAPPLNFTDGVDLLEGSALGLNFADADLTNIDVIFVDSVFVLQAGTLGATGGDFLSANLPGWHNVAIIRADTATTNPGRPHVVGHEMGHALMDGGDAIHARAPFQLPTSPIATNLFRPTDGGADAIGGPKRLDAEQNTRARDRSGPATVPPLLKQR